MSVPSGVGQSATATASAIFARGVEMLRRSVLAGLALSFAMVALATSADAALLAPGTSVVFGDVFAAPATLGGALLADTGTLFFNTTRFQGSYFMQVWSDPGPNLACSAGPCIDILFKVTNAATSLDGLRRISVADYGGLARAGRCP